MGNTIYGVGVGVGVGGVGVGVGVPLPLPFLLPEEVLIEILLWLPVKSLLRFKSVCKAWRELIQSPFFIHLHTIKTSSSSKFGPFILQSSPYKLGVDGWVRERTMFMLSFGSGSGDGDGDQVVFKLDDLGFPPYYKVFPQTHIILMVGSCNGLICLHDPELRDVSLWNPATRQFRILPKSITTQEEEEGIELFHDFVAFGFDVKIKDYKVVQVSFFNSTYIKPWRPGCICRVQVYSLSTDSWRLLEGIHSLPARPVLTDMQLGLYLNGSYFFVGRKCPPKLLSIEELNEQGQIHNNNLILSFDFTKEIFTTMQLPDHDRYESLLTHLGDKIALFTAECNDCDDQSRCDCDDRYRCDCDDYYENYDIWVLNEQGGDVNKESWAKLHSFQIKDTVAREWISPKAILNNGFALIETKTECHDGVFNELHLLNLVTKEPKTSFPICDKVLRACVYNHSLVSIIGGNGAATANRVVGGAMCPTPL